MVFRNLRKPYGYLGDSEQNVEDLQSGIFNRFILMPDNRVAMHGGVTCEQSHIYSEFAIDSRCVRTIDRTKRIARGGQERTRRW